MARTKSSFKILDNWVNIFFNCVVIYQGAVIIMKKILILGFSITGREASKYFIEEGLDVLIFDDVKKNDFIISDLSLIPWEDIDFIIASPGFSPFHLVYKLAKEKNIKILQEAEFSLKKLDQKIIAITGTNGRGGHIPPLFTSSTDDVNVTPGYPSRGRW